MSPYTSMWCIFPSPPRGSEYLQNQKVKLMDHVENRLRSVMMGAELHMPSWVQARRWSETTAALLLYEIKYQKGLSWQTEDLRGNERRGEEKPRRRKGSTPG